MSQLPAFRLGLVLLLSSSSVAQALSSVALPAKAAIIEDYKILDEAGFTVNKQEITTEINNPSSVSLAKVRADNRTLVAYFSKHKINIVPCSYKVSINRHDFKLAAGQVPESLTAYLYRVDFNTCQNLLEQLSTLAKEPTYPSTSDSTQKYPSMLYLLRHNNPVSILSMYGLASYYPQHVRAAVLDKIVGAN